MTTEAAPRPFGDLVREWRERRRVSQLDLAMEAGTTQRHLSFIERGRSLPGRAMVVRLADSLGLPMRESNSLLLSAGFAPVFPESPWEGEALSGVRDALQRVLDGHEPYPALVTNISGEMLARNSSLSLLIDGSAPELLEPPINALRLAMHPRGMQPRIHNFAEWGPHITTNLRREVARNADPRRVALLAELEGYLGDVDGPSRYPGFLVPLEINTAAGELRLLGTAMHFLTHYDVTLSELRIEAFLPADDATAAALRNYRK